MAVQGMEVFRSGGFVLVDIWVVVGLEGAPVRNELRGWNVKTGMVSRDRRGMDNVCLAIF